MSRTDLRILLVALSLSGVAATLVLLDRGPAGIFYLLAVVAYLVFLGRVIANR